MASFVDVCRFTPTAGGTADWTYSSAVQGYQSPTAAAIVNGRTYRYRAESADLSQWEVGYGTFNTGTGVLARTTVLFNSAGTTAKINFSSAPQVGVVWLAEDISALVATVSKQVFTSSGTYTPSTNLLYAIIECLGGGASGGGAALPAATTGQYGGGGGTSGSYSRTYASAATIGASQTVTIGAAGAAPSAGANNGNNGGATSVGTLCTANGGNGGKYGSIAQFGVGGTVAAAGTGDVAASGSGAGTGPYGTTSPLSSSFIASGFGASSQFGGGGSGQLNGAGGSGSSNGNAAGGYGAGGSGGIVQSQNTANAALSAAGGAGTAGIVIITEFCGPV